MSSGISQMAGTVVAISSVITMRPPYLSIQMPNGTRTSEPVSTGIAFGKPNSAALSPSAFLIGMAITPNIIQTMKHTVKASVLTSRTSRTSRPLALPCHVAVRFVAMRKL